MKRLHLWLLLVVLVVACSPAKIEVQSKGVALGDGTVVHFLEAGHGPALLLIHGLGASSDVWRDSISILARSYRVIAPDLPGYGKSDRPRASYSVSYYVAWLDDFVEALGLKKPAIAGNSLGGWIAAAYAIEHPEKVSHLILVNAAGLKRETLPPLNLNPSTKEELKVLLTALFADPSRVSDRVINEQWEYRRSVRDTVQATLASFRTAPLFVDDKLNKITVPTLIIWGRQDRIIPLEFGERFQKGISGSRLVILDNTGHLPQIENPRDFSKAVKRFVKRW